MKLQFILLIEYAQTAIMDGNLTFVQASKGFHQDWWGHRSLHTHSGEGHCGKTSCENERPSIQGCVGGSPLPCLLTHSCMEWHTHLSSWRFGFFWRRWVYTGECTLFPTMTLQPSVPNPMHLLMSSPILLCRKRVRVEAIASAVSPSKFIKPKKVDTTLFSV